MSNAPPLSAEETACEDLGLDYLGDVYYSKEEGRSSSSSVEDLWAYPTWG